jgi:DNA-directed RNA polymerase subunit RPC12/RpoP
MTEYLCHECGVKTTMSRHLDHADNIPTADECPNCGASDVDTFQYL